MSLKNIPQDLNIELLLSYLPEGSCKVHFGGLHKRNTYHDLTELSENEDNTFDLVIGRNSLYHILPEYMFHPIDRFENLPKLSEQEMFQKEYEAQTEEAENARRFFAPLDLMLLQLRMDLRDRLSIYTDSNKILIEMIGDQITEKQKQNRFIRQFIPLLPFCKNIRGNWTLLTILLRKIFIAENLRIDSTHSKHDFTDALPRYQEHVSGELGSLYVGNEYSEHVNTYTIHYWSESECTADFPKFLEELEELRGFIQDYFVALDDLIRFEIVNDDEPLILSGEDKYHYLNHNTNL